MNDPYTKYRHHKNLAKGRNISFELTFEEWWNIWQQSGKWEQRGRKKGQYVMSRFNDCGPYAVNNVKIQTQEDNIKEHVIGKKHTDIAKLNMSIAQNKSETIAKMKKALTGKRHSQETKDKMRQSRYKYLNELNTTVIN